MIMILCTDQQPAEPGRYWVNFYCDFHQRIIKGCVVFKYGFWHIGKRNRVIEWMPNEGKKKLTEMPAEDIELLKREIFMDLVEFKQNGKNVDFVYYEHEEISNFESRRICTATVGFGYMPYRGILWLVKNGYKLPQIK